MKEFMRKHPILVALVCLVIGIIGAGIPSASTQVLEAIRIAMTAFMILVIVIMGGGDSLTNIGKGAGHTLKKSIYPLVLAFLMGVFMVVASYMGGFINTEGLVLKELDYLFLCITIGLFEESMFRGVVFSGLQRKMGGTRGGLMGAVILSSLIFGFTHVTNYVFGGSYNLMGTIASVLKILQSGALGMLLAALYMRNRNLWTIALVHAVNDFFPMQGAILGDASLGNFVPSGQGAMNQSIMYAIYFLLYIPSIITSVRLIMRQKLPEYGIFKK